MSAQAPVPAVTVQELRGGRLDHEQHHVTHVTVDEATERCIECTLRLAAVMMISGLHVQSSRSVTDDDIFRGVLT